MNRIAFFTKETNLSLARFLLPMGVLLIIFGSIYNNVAQDTKDYIVTDAIVEDVKPIEEEVKGGSNTIRTIYGLSLSYKVKDNEYSANIKSASIYKKGDTIKIAYNPKNPKMITQAGNYILWSWVVIGAGIISIIYGVISLVKFKKKYDVFKEREKLWGAH